jgi:DNA-binding response OmpR family regulator
LASDALSGRRILVLEDEFLIAMDVELLCREKGADDIVILKNLEETGGAAAVAKRFDVAVLDLMLEGQSTVGFAQELVRLGVPFVIASGYSDLDELKSVVPGAPIVGKPYSGTVLMDAVLTALNRSGGV